MAESFRQTTRVFPPNYSSLFAKLLESFCRKDSSPLRRGLNKDYNTWLQNPCFQRFYFSKVMQHQSFSLIDFCRVSPSCPACSAMTIPSST